MFVSQGHPLDEGFDADRNRELLAEIGKRSKRSMEDHECCTNYCMAQLWNLQCFKHLCAVSPLLSNQLKTLAVEFMTAMHKPERPAKRRRKKKPKKKKERRRRREEEDDDEKNMKRRKRRKDEEFRDSGDEERMKRRRRRKRRRKNAYRMLPMPAVTTTWVAPKSEERREEEEENASLEKIGVEVTRKWRRKGASRLTYFSFLTIFQIIGK